MINGRLTVNDVARELKISPTTIHRWYLWWDSALEKPEGLYLPPYERTDGRKIKTFDPKDIEHFKRFQKNLPRGAMAEFNATYVWGKRGQSALDKKGISKAEVKKIIRDARKDI